MPLNGIDGQFGLDCWRSEDDEGEAKEVFSDNRLELEQEAERLIRAGHFGYIELSRWDADKDEWIKIDTYEAN